MTTASRRSQLLINRVELRRPQLTQGTANTLTESLVELDDTLGRTLAHVLYLMLHTGHSESENSLVHRLINLAVRIRQYSVQQIVLSNHLLVAVHRLLGVCAFLLFDWSCDRAQAHPCAESVMQAHSNDSVLCQNAGFLQVVAKLFD